MKIANVPALGARYWLALVMASALGTNTGDFAAHNLHLGHALGLLPLALLFAAILLAERRARRSTEAFYWLAILTLRTAATNLAGLADHDLHIAPLVVLAGLALTMTALVLTDRDAFANRRDAAGEVPATNARYWATMLLAGVLGTALGDYLADDIGLGPGLAALITLPVFGGMLGMRGAMGWRSKASYWIVVAAVRTAGTNLGDWIAAREGLGLGLTASTTITVLAFTAVVAVWRPRSAPSLTPTGRIA